MKCFKTLALLIGLCFFIIGNAQEKKKFKVQTIAFYNLENLFDTENDPNKFDEASPIMEMKANREEVYLKKVENMAKVISEIGYEVSKNSPVVIGVSEVENMKVLHDLVNHPLSS